MITLTKEAGPASLEGVEKLRIGAAWDTSTGMSGGLIGKIKQRIGSDLDLVCIGVAGNNPVRYVGIDNLDPMGGSVVHTGDNTTGRGEGDDEQIDVTFDKIPPNITELHFVIAAFKRGSSFDRAKNVEFNIYDGTGGQFDPVACTMPSLFGNHNAHKVLRAFRSDSHWEMEVEDRPGSITQGDPNSLLRFAIR